MTWRGNDTIVAKNAKNQHRLNKINPSGTLGLVVYAGTEKRHNVCKRHVSIDTVFKQTKRAIFLDII